MEQNLQMMLFIAVIVFVAVIVIAAWLAHSRRSRRRCPICGAVWREGAIGCLRCKYSPTLPPAYVPIDDGSLYDNRPVVHSSYSGDESAPWIRRNF